VRVILVPMGSSGDVLPFVALGAELRRRGHDVRIIASPYFQDVIAAEHLTLVPFGTREEYLAAARDPRIWDPRQGFRVIADEFVAPQIEPMYAHVEGQIDGGNTVVVGSALALGARLAHDRLGVPFATVHLQPSMFRSLIDPPNVGMRMPRSRLGRRALYWLIDLAAIDRYLRGPINRARRHLGLAPIRHVDPWWHSPQRIIGLFPEWFAPPAADWLPQTRLTGFPLADGRAARPLPDELRSWIDGGEAPVVFTFGSAMTHAHALFAASAAACQRLGCRGVLLTPFREQIPANLQADVRHFDYAPFGELFPRTRAVVHHGGIGTTSQALAAGCPQLIVPFTHDQPDNADRVRRLSAGAVLRPVDAAGDGIAHALGNLLSDAAIAQGARECARRAAEDADAIPRACALVEALGAEHAA